MFTQGTSGTSLGGMHIGPGITITSTHDVVGSTLGGTEVKATRRVGNINPRLYFSYVKSKLNDMELTKLKIRLDKLKKLVQSTVELGQQAAFEEFSRQLAVTVRESEAAACGIKGYVLKEHIEKFRSLTKDVHFTTFDKFPRAVPEIVRSKIKDIKSKDLFDEFWILYLDYKEPLKTNKEKIREKDPILFGKYSYEPDKYYFIIDWVDQYCDLTITKFVDTIKIKEIEKIPEIDEKLIAKIMKDVKDRTDRLNNTKPSNFRELMKEEDNVWGKIKKFFSKGKTGKST
jgi:hypothetical protein